MTQLNNPDDGTNKGDDKNKAAGEAKIAADLKAEIEGLKGMLEKQQKANEAVMAEMKQSQSVLTSAEYMDFVESQQEGGKGRSGGSGEVDLNAMSRTEFADHVSGGLTKVMTNMAKQMDEQMDKMMKTVGSLGSKTDVELTKLRSPAFAKAVEADEGKKLFIQIGEENPTWSAAKIWDAMETQQIVAAKKEADLIASQAEEEKEVWSEKPGAAASIAEEKNLTDEEIAGRAYDAVFGTNPGLLEEESAGVISAD